MAKDIVMLHGASAGGWCFDKFRGVFESLGWTCHAPDLIGHGKDKAGADTKLVGVGLTNHRAEFEAFLETLPSQPVLLGHSMGAVLAQQLAASGLARALILVSPAPRAGRPRAPQPRHIAMPNSGRRRHGHMLVVESGADEIARLMTFPR